MVKTILCQAKKSLAGALLCSISVTAFAQNVTISVNATQDKRLISPNIYGKNDFLDKSDQFYKDAGLRFARMNGGNNASAYNWRAKLAVHPDWYNNVYPADWDAMAQKVNNNFSNMQGMFAFQLLGRAASNNSNNFNDWEYNQAQYWSGVGQNLAGGGQVNPAGGTQALVDGNIDLFSKPWPADSSVAILDHWFGANGLGLDKNRFRYWSMDNEVDIWNGTHDWAMPTLISASAFMDRFIELAKKAKAIDPNVKICGPVTTSEWQWYRWSNESIVVDGRYYPWLEYFIKRLGDEYKATGIKLVDVLDIHNYPWYNGDDAAALQGHRIYYDETYDYPGSNGIRTMNGGWDTSITKQYIFKRIDGWLTEHFGANHGVTTGVSEWGTMSSSNPSLESVIYASHLGTFANHGVELFAPWNWSVGMWETLHLFSRNAKKYSVASTSSLENTVSAYSSVTENADSLTVMLVNRDMNAPRTVTINLNNFTVANGNYKTLQLASLPATETFVSDTQNALQEGTASVNSNSLTITVPALSTTAILLANQTTLPVNLISFSGKASSEGNVLLWSTVGEVNNEGFEIERAADGMTFEKIGFVAGKGTASARADYQFVDQQPLANAYYRLKQLDSDHSYTLSKSINLKNESGIRLIVYPNPVKGKLYFDVPPAKRRLVVRNMAGVVVDDRADFSATNYETGHLPKGLYLISLGAYTFKVAIE
ncbi:glycoside hydrolase family 44 protein [Dyadobacter sp. BHUBP1]|uniref:glycoside hydrolase family 44 protein n=1 Tax=Dyadobacter sp. BHUBP1 TaxID=3424178 RepID=UPI003D3349E3